jgi:hypothetical protein
MMFNSAHALVIGIGTYAAAPQLSASITAQDAEQVAALLRDPQVCGYPAEQVTLLRDSNATSENILKALDQLAGTATEGDTALIFYSGHGAYGADGYYLTTYETEIKGGLVVAGTGVRDKELLTRLNSLRTQRTFLIFNACHAGALAPDTLDAEDRDASLPDALATALLSTGEGRVVITACRANQKSYFLPDDPATLFAQALLDGLRGNGVNNHRGYIGVFDLYDHVFTRVSGDVKRRWGLTQEPELTIHKGIGALAVALYSGAQPTSPPAMEATPPARLGGVAREVEPSESQRALAQILSGALNLAAGRDIAGNTIIGNQLNAQGSSGTINQVRGSINQRTINTGGGDYAERDINKQQGAFISGGTIYGPVVGVNKGGTINYNRHDTPDTTGQSPIVLDEVLRRLRETLAELQQRDENLAAELQRIEVDMSGASRAQQANDAARRQRLLSRAKQELAALSDEHGQLQSLAAMLQQVE